MSRQTRVIVFLFLAQYVSFASGESVMPFSQLMKDDLANNAAVTPYYDEVLDAVAYYSVLD